MDDKKQKEKVLHVGSVVLALFSVVVFWQLGGGSTSASGEDAEARGGINTEMPGVGESVRIGRTKSENISYTAQIDDERQKRDAAAASSFDWFDNDEKAPTPASEYEREKSGRSTSEELERALAESDRIIADSQKNAAVPEAAAPKSNGSAGGGKKSGAGVRSGESLEEYTARRQAEADARRRAELEKSEKKEPERPAETEKKEVEAPKEEKVPKQSFYNLDGAVGDSKSGSLARAVVHGTHSNMKSGSVVKLRLLDGVSVGGKDIPRNTFVYGVLSVNGNRAHIRIDNINWKNQILPFNASIYDQDGMEGIYIPGNVVSDTKDKAGADVISSTDVSMPSSVNSLVATGVNAVTGAVKSAAASAVRETKISISTNYQVLIKIKER